MSITIAELRKERGETLEQFANALGLKSKSRASEIESSNRCESVDVALKIEALAGGRIDAAEICEDVAKARAPKADAA